MWTTPRSEPAPVRMRPSPLEAPRAPRFRRYARAHATCALSRHQLEEITDKSLALRVLRVCLVLLLMAAAGALGAAAFLLFQCVGLAGAARLPARALTPRAAQAGRGACVQAAVRGGCRPGG
jgi:hypothetical protein